MDCSSYSKKKKEKKAQDFLRQEAADCFHTTQKKTWLIGFLQPARGTPARRIYFLNLHTNHLFFKQLPPLSFCIK